MPEAAKTRRVLWAVNAIQHAAKPPSRSTAWMLTSRKYSAKFKWQTRPKDCGSYPDIPASGPRILFLPDGWVPAYRSSLTSPVAGSIWMPRSRRMASQAASLSATRCLKRSASIASCSAFVMDFACANMAAFSREQNEAQREIFRSHCASRHKARRDCQRTVVAGSPPRIAALPISNSPAQCLCTAAEATEISTPN